MSRIIALVKAVIARVQALLLRLRADRPIVDHLFQAAGRYSRDRGGQLTSVITLPGFLSFFPLLGLALSVAGYVSAYDHDAQRQITKAVGSYFPGLNLDQLIQSITENRTSTGIISLVGLVLSGLGLITTLRTALRELFHLPQSAGNFFVAKGKDLVTLLSMGLALLASFALTGAATSATTVLANHIPFLQGTVVRVLLQVAAYVIAVGADTLLFAVAYKLLPQTPARLGETLDGALLGAVGFVALQAVGAVYLQRTTSNPLYGSFAVAIGLLVWTKLVAQLFVFAAAWAVTAPYDPDTPPSATAVARGPGVPALHVPANGPARPAARPVTPVRGEAYARGAGTAAFGAVVGVAVVVGVRAVRAVVPKRR